MKKKKLSYTTKIVIMVTAFLVAIDVILGLILGSTSAKSTKEILNHKMLEMAQTAATLVDGDEIRSFPGTRNVRVSTEVSKDICFTAEDTL